MFVRKIFSEKCKKYVAVSRSRVKEHVAGRTGASWEDRLQEQKAKKIQAMKMIEKATTGFLVVVTTDERRSLMYLRASWLRSL